MFLKFFYNQERVRPNTKMRLCQPIKAFFVAQEKLQGSTVVVSFASDHSACGLV